VCLIKKKEGVFAVILPENTSTWLKLFKNLVLRQILYNYVAIIQAFTALWVIKCEQMAIIFYIFVLVFQTYGYFNWISRSDHNF
jgi:hypothetical protein